MKPGKRQQAVTAEDSKDVKSDDAEDVKSDATDSNPEDEKLDAGAKEVIRRERQNAKEATRRATEAESKLADAQKIIDEAANAKATQDEEDAKAKGEFQKLADDRKVKLDEATGTIKSLTQERDDLAAKVLTYETAQAAVISEWIKAHKDQHADLMDYYPGDEASLELKQTWFEKTRKNVESRTGNGFKPPRTPNANGSLDQKQDEAARLAASRANQRRF